MLDPQVAQALAALQLMKAAGIHPDPTLIEFIARGLGVPYEDVMRSAEPPKLKEPPPVSDQLPKEQLLLKLLKMTTSSNDGEALVAIRKVNTILTDNGWDWDKFVAGKIKIVDNPFKNLGTPPRRDYQNGATVAPQPAPPRRAPLQGQFVRGLGPNKFADHCYCCGIEVIAGAGLFFNRADYNLNAVNANPRSKFSVVCMTCEGNKTIWDQPAAPIRKRGKASINDLA